MGAVELPRADAGDDAAEHAGDESAGDDHVHADVLGHGDLKPSNVLRLRRGGITFIDFELAGPNYRGYDIFKLFRTSKLPAASDASPSRSPGTSGPT